MPDQTSQLAAIMSRLERVEKENRRMKQVALGVLVIAGSVILMGQARPNKNKTIEAERFIVRDERGIVRAEFGLDEFYERGGASLVLGAPDLAEGYDSHNEPFVLTLHGGDYAWLNLRSADSEEYLNARLAADPDTGPKLSLSDRDNYETDIGNTDLVTTRTGEKHHTSAASIVMFEKDKKVLWSAP